MKELNKSFKASSEMIDSFIRLDNVFASAINDLNKYNKISKGKKSQKESDKIIVTLGKEFNAFESEYRDLKKTKLYSNIENTYQKILDEYAKFIG